MHQSIEAVGKIIAVLVPVFMAGMGIAKMYMEVLKLRAEADAAHAKLRGENGEPGKCRKMSYAPWRKRNANFPKSPSDLVCPQTTPEEHSGRAQANENDGNKS